MNLNQLPNLISLARLLLAVPIALLLLFEQYLAALLVFVIASLSDGLDGYLARHYAWSSRFGGVLDALADKFLMVVVLLTLLAKGLLPGWLILVVLGREVFIGLGAMAYRLLIGPYEPAPNLASKVNTSVLMVLVMFTVLAQLPVLLPVPDLLLEVLVALVAAMALVSGGVYVAHWGRQAYQALRAPQR